MRINLEVEHKCENALLPCATEEGLCIYRTRAALGRAFTGISARKAFGSQTQWQGPRQAPHHVLWCWAAPGSQSHLVATTAPPLALYLEHNLT
jgi:hypothetical protein